MPQSTQDGSRIKPLTDEFAQLSKPRPAAGGMPPVQGIWTLGAIAEKWIEMRALDLALDM